ncbi:MAG: hypothetical protein H6Q16_1473 [Bacteroidetes bacterium]|nr:hypothetical protein [Bacteroidota bacterium]
MKKILLFTILIIVSFSFSSITHEKNTNPTKKLKEATSVEYTDVFGEPDTMFVNFNNDKLLITPEGKIFKNNKLFIDLEMEDEYFEIESLYFIFEEDFIIAIYTETDMDYAGSVAKMVSLKDNKVKWTLYLGGFNMSIPLYDDNFIYVTTIGGINKIDYKKGKFDWKFDDLYDNGKYNSFDQPIFYNDTLIIFKSYSDTIIVDDKNKKIILKQ